jgi:hypothetical protein
VRCAVNVVRIGGNVGKCRSFDVENYGQSTVCILVDRPDGGYRVYYCTVGLRIECSDARCYSQQHTATGVLVEVVISTA